MGHLWRLLTNMHSLAGYASVMDMELSSKYEDDKEQWLPYWILYSLITLIEMALEPLLKWIPIWYDVKLVLVAWLVLPQFKGAAFLYRKFVRLTADRRSSR